MISRDDARRIAERLAWTRELGLIVDRVMALSEIAWRRPSLYGFSDLSAFWIVYASQPGTKLGASTVVLVSKATGDIAYAGSANDEG
jgi:hypothetical protein